MMRVGVLIPVAQGICEETVQCLYGYSRHMLRESNGSVDVEWVVRQSSLLNKGRTRLLETALQRQFDVVLWLDSDMQFWFDVPSTLIQQAVENHAVVGVDYARRAWPHDRVASIVQDGKAVHLPRGEHKLVEVNCTGFGLLAMPLSIMEGIPQPWFHSGQREDGQWFGEDWWFSERLRQFAGIKTYVNQQASLRVGHLGRISIPLYTHDDNQAEMT